MTFEEGDNKMQHEIVQSFIFNCERVYHFKHNLSCESVVDGYMYIHIIGDQKLQGLWFLVSESSINKISGSMLVLFSSARAVLQCPKVKLWSLGSVNFMED